MSINQNMHQIPALGNNTTEADFQKVAIRRRNDGSMYKTRQQMKEEYNNSMLPYPIKAIFRLDYCKKIIKSHLQQSLIFSIPISFVVAYATNPDVRTKGMRSRGFSFYLSAYILTYMGFITYFCIDSLVFCDYCKPWSKIYAEENDSTYFRDILVDRIKTEQKKTDAVIMKTKTIGLKDEELDI